MENTIQFISDKVSVLDLSASEVTDACLFKLAACRNLRKVDLNSVKASNQTITSAGQLKFKG